MSFQIGFLHENYHPVVVEFVNYEENGQLELTGLALYKYYNTKSKALVLIGLGSSTSLGVCPKVFKAPIFNILKEFEKISVHQYLYSHANNGWLVRENDGRWWHLSKLLRQRSKRIISQYYYDYFYHS